MRYEKIKQIVEDEEIPTRTENTKASCLFLILEELKQIKKLFEVKRERKNSKGRKKTRAVIAKGNSSVRNRSPCGRKRKGDGAISPVRGVSGSDGQGGTGGDSGFEAKTTAGDFDS